MQPMDSVVLTAALAQFSKVSLVMSGIVGLTVIARFTFLVVTIASAEAYGHVLKGLVVYLVGISIFPKLLEVAVDITGSIALAIPLEAPPKETGVVERYLEVVQPQLGFIGVALDIGRFGIPHLAQAVYGLLLALLIAVGPVVLFVAALISGGGFQAYAISLLTLLLWPLCWNLFGALALELKAAASITSLGKYIYWFVVQILQLFSPLFTVMIFRNLSVGSAIQAPVKAVVMMKAVATAATSRQFLGRAVRKRPSPRRRTR